MLLGQVPAAVVVHQAFRPGPDLQGPVAEVMDLALLLRHRQHPAAPQGSGVPALATALGKEGGLVQGYGPAVFFFPAVQDSGGKMPEGGVLLIELSCVHSLTHFCFFVILPQGRGPGKAPGNGIFSQKFPGFVIDFRRLWTYYSDVGLWPRNRPNKEGTPWTQEVIAAHRRCDDPRDLVSLGPRRYVPECAVLP